MLVTLYKVNNSTGGFLMLAPLETIEIVYGFHRLATERVRHETEVNGGQCRIFDNRDPESRLKLVIEKFGTQEV